MRKQEDKEMEAIVRNKKERAKGSLEETKNQVSRGASIAEQEL